MEQEGISGEIHLPLSSLLLGYHIDAVLFNRENWLEQGFRVYPLCINILTNSNYTVL